MAEGVAWKLAPLRLHPDYYELSLDNDCILWSMPPAVEQWLAHEDALLLAADVAAMYGKFAPRCPPEPLNSGIRGLPPGFDFERALQQVLTEVEGPLGSELDEQGLQVAALSQRGRPLVVPVTDVSICSPFPPHLPHLGACGAHFIGLNVKALSVGDQRPPSRGVDRGALGPAPPDAVRERGRRAASRSRVSHARGALRHGQPVLDNARRMA